MDRAELSKLLSDGLSIKAIARAKECSPGTVSYWIRKHGLTPPNQQFRRGKEKPTRDVLVSLMDGRSVAEAAKEAGTGVHTFRRWLKQDGIPSGAQLAKSRNAALTAQNTKNPEGHCPKHGAATFARRQSGSWSCRKCLSEAVGDYRRRLKARLATSLGGSCWACGYDRYLGALDFHHVDPEQKSFGLSRRDGAGTVVRGAVGGSGKMRPPLPGLPRGG